MASEPGPSSLGHDKPSEPGKSAFFILCAPQDRFRQEDYTDPSKELFEDFLAHMDGKLSHTNPKILSGIDMASRTTAGKCAVLFLDSVPKIIPEFHKHMTSLLIDNHKFMMLERKKKKMMPSSSAPVEGQAAHKPFSVINMYVSERAVGIPDEKLLSVVMKQNHFPGTVQLVHLKKVGEGRQVKMTGDLELMNHLSRFPISHKFSLGTSRVCLKSDNRRLPSSQQIEPSYLTPGIPTATDYAQGGPSLPHAPQVNPRDHLQPTFGSVAVKAHPRAPSMFPPKFANSHEPPVHTSSSKKGKRKKKKKKGKNNRAFEEEEEKTPILPTYQELLKYSTGVADGPEGYPGQEIVVVIAGEGDVLGTIDPCGVWRANGGKFASLKKSEIDKITAEINKKRVKESIKEEAQLMLENDCAEEEAEDSVPEQRYEHFSGVGNVLGTIKPGGIWRANKGKFGKMSRAQIRNKLAKEEKCLEPALLTEVKGIPGEKKTLILEKHGRVSGIFDSAGNWRSNMLKFNSMTKEAIERKDLDQEQLKERFRLNAELKRSSEALSDKKEEHFYGAPGTTKFFYFHGEGNLLGTYDNFSNWVACTGRFQGKSKGFIRQTIAKEQESNVLKELKTIVAKKGYSHKAAHGTPGDKKVLKFTGNVEVMGTYNTDGVWIADEGTEWAGRTRGSIAVQCKRVIHTEDEPFNPKAPVNKSTNITGVPGGKGFFSYRNRIISGVFDKAGVWRCQSEKDFKDYPSGRLIKELNKMSSDMEDKDNLKVDSNYLGSPQTQAYLIIRQQQRHQPCQGDRNIIGTFDGLGHWRDDRSNLTAPQVLESITERAKIRKEIEMTVLDINGRVIPGQVADYALTGKPGEKRWLPFVEGPLLGTFDTEGIWRLDRGRLATRTRREISIILDHEWFDNPHGLFHKYFEPVDPTRMFNETLPIGHLRRSPIGKPGHKMLYNFPVDGTTLGTFDSTGTWRADTGKYATMTRNEIQLAVQKDLDSVASGKVKGADVYKKKKDEFVGKKGEQCLVKFNFGNMLGTFGKDGVWTANTGRFQGLGRKRIQKLLDLEGKRYKYFNVPKFSDLTVEQKLGIHTGNFQGNPGSKCLVIFPLIGQVYGTFNRHGIWIADSGKYSGQSKQSIQKEVDKKISKESKGKLCGDPGTFRTVEFVGEGPIEGVFSALGKWSAISGRYAGMDKAEIEKCILEEINTSSPALVNEDNSDIPVHENPQYNLFELLDWDNMASSYVGIHDPRKPYPGKKHTFKFPALGPLHGNFDLNNVWIVNSGRFQGKSKKDMCDLLIILKNRIISGKIKLKPEMIAIPETPASQAEKLLEIEDDPNCNVRELLSDNFDAMPRDEPSFKNIYYGKRYTYNFPCVGPVLGFYDEKRKWRSAIGRFAGKTKEDIVATLYQKHARLRGEMIAMDTETLEKTEQRKRHAETWNAQMTDQELDTGLKIEDDPRYNLRELLENNFSCILNEEPSSTEPGMTYTYIFACIGPVTGTFDDNNVWLADSGQFMGKPKRIIKIFLNNLRRKLDRGVIKLNTKNEIDQRHREQMYLGPGPKRSRLDESPLPEPSFKTPVHEVSFRTPIPEASFKTPIPTSASFMHPITISKDAFSESDNFRRRIHIQDKIPTPSLPTPVPPPSNYPVMVPPPREFVSRSGTSDNFNAYDSSFHPRETRLNQNAYDESWGPESSRSSGLPSQSRVSVPDDSDRPITSRDLAMPQDFEIRRNSLPERFDTSRHNFCDIPSSSRDLSNHSDWNQAHVSSVKSGPGMSLEMGIPSDRYLGSRDLPEQPSGLPFNSSDEIHHASHLGANARPDQQPNNRRPSVFQEYVDQLKGKETHNLLTTDKPQSLMSIQIPDNVAHKANFLLPSSSSSVLPESFAVGSEDCGNHRSQDTMWYENKLKSHLEAAKEKLSDAKYQRHIAKNPPPQEGEEKPKKRFDFKAQLEKLKQMTPILDPKLLNIAAPPEASEKKGKKKQQTETLGSSLPPVPKLPSQRPADKEFDGDIYYLVQKKTNEGPEEQWISPVQFAFDAITSEALEKTNELFQGWAKTIHYTKLELNGLGVICTSKTEPERVMTYLDIVSKIRKFDYQFKVFSKETVLNHYAVTIFMNQRLKHLRTPRVMKMLKADNPNIPGDPEVLVIKEFDGDKSSAPKAMIKTFALLIDGDNDFFSWLAREPVGRRYKCWRDSVEIKGGWRAGPTQQQWESLGIDQHVIDMILASNMDEILQACLDEEELSVKDKASLRKQLNARKLFMSDVRQSVNFTDFQERRKAREAQMTKMKDTGVTGIGQSIVEGTSSEHMDIDSSLADEDLDVQEDFNVPDNFSTLPNYNPKEAAYIINDVPDANPVGSESNIITIFLQRHHQIRLHAILDIIMKKNPELKGSFEIIAVEEFQESDIDEFGKSLRGCRLLTCEGDEEFMQSLYPFHNRSWFVMFSRAGDIQIRGGKRDPNATPIKQKKVKKINKGSANNAGKEQHEHEPAV